MSLSAASTRRSISRGTLVMAVNLLLALVCVTTVCAGDNSDRQNRANYELANKFSNQFINQYVYSSSVRPNWIGETDVFWYSYRRADGWHYNIVHPSDATKSPLFNHADMAADLSMLLRTPIDTATMNLGQLRFKDDGSSFRFEIDERTFEYAMTARSLREVPKEELDAEREAARREAEAEREKREQEQREQQEQDQDQKRDDDDDDDDDDQKREDKIDDEQKKDDDTKQDDQQQHDTEQIKDDTQEQILTDEQKQDTDKDKDTDQNTQQDQDQDHLEQDRRRRVHDIDVQTVDADAQRNADDAAEEPDTSYRNYSPDKSCYVYMLEHNLYFAEEGKESEAIQLTEDGEDKYTFPTRQQRRGRGQQQQREQDQQQEEADSDEPRKQFVNVQWSEDSQYFYVTRRDSRGIAELFLVNSLTEPRPALETYDYPMPGEDSVRRTELHIFRAADRALAKVDQKWRDESYSNLEWGDAPNKLRMIRRARTRRALEYCELDLATGESSVLVEESIVGGNLASQAPRYIKDGKEFIWWSEFSGWGHYYRYDRDGTLLNAITSGPCRFSRIVDIDEEKGLMWVIGNAREPGENVYFSHLYKVFLDGSGLTLLDPGDANHNSTLSPSRKYIVDNCSRVDMAPVSYLRDEHGKVILTLEEMDLSRLHQTGWKMPETFVVKAADGVTDLYGNMWKPFDFDPQKSYPIILHVYPGPQTEGVTHTFSATGGGRQQLAQLGFIVVQVGHRGGTPGRSKAYHSYGYNNLRDYPLADKKTAIEQLAQMHPYIDIRNVGIYGHSGGGFLSAAALLQPPYNEFFTVGVASAGNHDNNVYNNTWSEQYHGLTEIQVEIKQEQQDGEEELTQEQLRERMMQMREEMQDEDTTDERRQELRDEMRRMMEQRGVGEGEGNRGRGRGVGRRGNRQNNNNVDTDTDTDDGDAENQRGQEVERQQDRDGDGQERQEQDGQQRQRTREQQEEKRVETKFEIHIPTNHELAENLRGHLMLVHGDMDNNVHPAGTIRLVNALIKANKRFDFMLFPGKRHGFGDMQGYFTQMMWEYFAEHLLGDRQTGADMNVKE